MRILLIDDNQQITKMLSQVLEIEGHECTISNDGNEGLDKIISIQYDIIVLDLSMPDFSGFDIIDALEKKDLLSKNKIIIFTAASVPESTLDALVERGVDSYLTKPIDIDVFLEKIRSVEI